MSIVVGAPSISGHCRRLPRQLTPERRPKCRRLARADHHKARAGAQQHQAKSLLMEEMCRKTLFAPVMKNSAGCRRQFRVKMWGTSLRDDKLTGGLGNAIAATEIRGRRLDSV